LLAAECWQNGLLKDWPGEQWPSDLDWALLLQDRWLTHWGLHSAVAGLLLDWAKLDWAKLDWALLLQDWTLLLQDGWLTHWGLHSAVAGLLLDWALLLLQDWALLLLQDWALLLLQDWALWCLDDWCLDWDLDWGWCAVGVCQAGFFAGWSAWYWHWPLYGSRCRVGI
jgi:hypothetical protein